MHKPFRTLLTVALLATASAGTSGTASAGESFGLNTQWKILHVTQFQLMSPQCGWSYWSYGYQAVIPAPGGTCNAPQARANVELPEGASMQSFYLLYYSSAGAITASMYRFNSDLNGGAPSSALVGTPLVSTKTSGFASDWKSLGTLNGGTMTYPVYKTWDPAGSGAERDYQFVVNFPNDPSTVYFKGIALMFQRQVAPAPAGAAFTDVQANHPFFNEIEQLRKSGVTQGCGNSQFCPDSPVTRGQMAAFLARALGLQWDWNTNAP